MPRSCVLLGKTPRRTAAKSHSTKDRRKLGRDLQPHTVPTLHSCGIPDVAGPKDPHRLVTANKASPAVAVYPRYQIPLHTGSSDCGVCRLDIRWLSRLHGKNARARRTPLQSSSLCHGNSYSLLPGCLQFLDDTFGAIDLFKRLRDCGTVHGNCAVFSWLIGVVAP